MKKIISEMLTSKKAVSAIAGMIVAGIARVGLDLPVEDVATILSPILAYIVGQGIADNGKEAVKLNRETL